MEEYRRVIRTMLTRSASSEFYDMEVINDLYAGNAMIIPNDYWVVSGEFRRKTHQGYLDEGEVWDANRILNETKVVHFSDWPRPKPWFPASDDILAKTTPACDTMPGSAHQDCSNRDAWLWLYKDFAERRGVCATFQLFERITNILAESLWSGVYTVLEQTADMQSKLCTYSNPTKLKQYKMGSWCQLPSILGLTHAGVRETT